VPAVPVGAIAERRLIRRLLKADAVRSEAAQPLENLRWAQQRRLERLIDLGVIREAGTTSTRRHWPTASRLVACASCWRCWR
jgi:hypothetical protein